MATMNLPTGLHVAAKPASLDRLSSAKNVGDLFFSDSRHRKRVNTSNQIMAVQSLEHIHGVNNNVYANYVNFNVPSSGYSLGQESVYLNSPRKTKIVCTIGPSTSSREMIWKLAEAGMNVARLNMSHGDHASHQRTIDLVKEYNAQFEDKVIAIMLDTKGPEVISGDVPKPILLKEGQEFNFSIKRGVSTEDTVSVNYDDFINDVEAGDILLVDGGMMSLAVKSKTSDIVKCEVIDGGELKSRRHLNVRGKSATLPSITEKDWDDIKFGVNNQVDFYAVSFVKDAKVVHELKDYLKSCNADIHVIVKIESADSIPNLHSIISASDGAMVARGDLGAELPIEEVPLLQEDIIRRCQSMQKPVIVATNMLESMIDHPTPTRAEVSDISIAVREGADAVMLSGETAHGKYPLKAVKVMHIVALRTESSLQKSTSSPSQSAAYKSHMGEMFAFHSSSMANTLSTPIIVFTRTGSMAIILSHNRPSSTVFAFTNNERVKQRLALYHGVVPIYMEFSSDAEETFSRAIKLLLSKSLVKDGQYVTLVQSGAQPIWRRHSTHHIQVRKVQS
ncbi:pyruvate kinase isozyme G, chloroplastic [Nicotiana tabacum]|uniref:Pyruvate kinase isozyme G, chloroplastic n=2 Tax=Nicotiana tabacum TaxID=4097 RepID=KPYG_TOBAC|nr:pyruvate kinase isozyme G, chloroplastic [Nicotiana tabacum]Q40546.1 RecName: Full=Pyruvate kinase isozyme G, chloroplastic; Flags: Precursor [Nicotiana tabacum]CAA49996.1 pyruvate kinase [Nicotiana tabacum]CAA82223.1 Pyruvate kinase; plastid isozyme [Nicotiana tabacum]